MIEVAQISIDGPTNSAPGDAADVTVQLGRCHPIDLIPRCLRGGKLANGFGGGLRRGARGSDNQKIASGLCEQTHCNAANERLSNGVETLRSERDEVDLIVS